MVPVAKTVVDVGTVMVELLNALLAEQTVECFIWLDGLTVETKVLIVNVVLVRIFKDSLQSDEVSLVTYNDVELLFNEAWVTRACQDVEESAEEEEYCANDC